MWPSKMFLLSKERSGLGRTKGRRTWEGREGSFFVFYFLKLFITFLGVRITQKGGKEGTTILGSDWVIQEKIPSWSVPMPKRKRKPTYNYTQPPLCEPALSLLVSIPSDGHAQLVPQSRFPSGRL